MKETDHNNNNDDDDNNNNINNHNIRRRFVSSNKSQGARGDGAHAMEHTTQVWSEGGKPTIFHTIRVGGGDMEERSM